MDVIKMEIGRKFFEMGNSKTNFEYYSRFECLWNGVP